MIGEPAAYKDLLPFCSVSRSVKVYDLMEKDVFIKFKIPFLNERLMLMHLLAIDRLDYNNSILIYGYSVSQQKI